jgi:glycosyltransferase involved in cell wall biosynthesis
MPTGNEALWHNPQSGIGAPQKRGFALVVTIHDLIPLMMPQAAKPGFLALFEEQVPRAVLQSDMLITPSEHTKADLVRLLGVTPGRITVTGEAPLPCFRPVPQADARAKVAARHGLKDPYVLYVGGFSPRKNLGALVEAFARAKPDLGDGRKLAIAGSPDAALGQALELAHRLGCGKHIACLGHVGQGDMPYLYSAADVFVYPSLYEGFGLPPLEAMACGCPVVASDAASLPEVCGPAALLVDARDPGALAAAIAHAVLDPGLAAEMRLRGIGRAAEFTWTEVAGRTLAAYAEALEAGTDTRRDC